MATSRYDTPAATNANTAANVRANTGQATSQSGDSQTVSGGSSQSNTTGSSRTEQNSNTSSYTQNMTGSSLAALETLIAQLLGGGTQDMAQQRADRIAEIRTNQAERAGYTKENAFADAQGLMAQTMRQTLEKLLPSINRGAEGAGTSSGSMRALLTQKAGLEAAQAASANGLNAAVQYGNVNTQFGSILERLTQPDNSVTNALLQALSTARGAVTSTQSSTNGTSTTDSTQQTQSQQQQQSNTNTNQNSTTVPTSGGSSRIGGGNSEGLVYFGPQQTAPTGTAGTTQDFLEQLQGSNNGWSNSFTF